MSTLTNPAPTQQGETLEPLTDREFQQMEQWAGAGIADPQPYSDLMKLAVKTDAFLQRAIQEIRRTRRAADAGPRADRALYSELIHIAAELARGTDFLSTCAEDMAPRLKRADILKTAERQDLQLKDWANRVRQVADKLSAAAGAEPRLNERCEWNPVLRVASLDPPRDTDCRNETWWSIGHGDRNFHVCDSCAKLPEFKLRSRRDPINANPAATSSPTPADVKAVADRVNAGVEQMDKSQRVDAATMRIEFNPAPAESESCSHWREGDSDNCPLCGVDLGPTTEADGPVPP